MGAQLGLERRWTIEDCRHLSRRLERDLLAAGGQIVRVTRKRMAHLRDSARAYGKSDPIDALAVARAALREALPTARLDGSEREVRLLVDHREDPLAERTRIIGRLRWHLHELDPTWAQPTAPWTEPAPTTPLRPTCPPYPTTMPDWLLAWPAVWSSTCGA